MATWFRFYASALNDPKVQRLPAEQFRTWVNVLCLACEHDGELPSLADVAFSLRVSEAEAAAMLAKLQELELLDSIPCDGSDATESLTPHNWKARQFRSDSSTERVKRFRNVTSEPPGNVPETLSDARDETLPKRLARTRAGSETEQNRDRTETEEEASLRSAPTKPKRKRTEIAYLPDFDAWWKTYPKPVDKPKAYREWLKLDAADWPELATATTNYAATVDYEYQRHPERFLRDGFWRTFINRRPGNGAASAPAAPVPFVKIPEPDYGPPREEARRIALEVESRK